MKVIKKFINCSCGSETILLEKFEDEESIYVSLFGRGLNIKRYNLSDKIRHIWQIVKTGFPYTDELVLDRKRALELSKALKNLCK